jgi:hypothetical protein
LKLPKNKKEQPFKLAPLSDIEDVIKMAIGGKDFMDIDDWKGFFNSVTNLIF